MIQRIPSAEHQLSRSASGGDSGETLDQQGPGRLVRLDLHRAVPIVLAVVLLTLVVWAGGVFSGADQSDIVPAANSLLIASTTEARKQSGYAVPREFTGRVEARRESLLSVELDGLFTDVLVDEGDQVKQGDVLARLDTDLLHSRRESVAARLAGAQAQLDEMISGPRAEVIAAARAQVEQWAARQQLATVTHERNKRLVVGNAVSRQAYDDSGFGQQAVQAQLDAAQARLLELENGTRREQIAAQRAAVRHLEAELKTIDINLQKSNLLAPYAGVVSERFVDEGTVVEAGTPVVQLLETGALDVRIGVTEDVLAGLTRGVEQELTINGATYSATVRSIRPDRDQVTRTVSVILTLSESGSAIHVGDLATLRISADVDQAGFWLPISALTESYRGLWGALVAKPNPAADTESQLTHTLEVRELEFLHQSADEAFVRGSLQDGERVVAVGTQRLVPGQQVTLSEFREEQRLATHP